MLLGWSSREPAQHRLEDGANAARFRLPARLRRRDAGHMRSDLDGLDFRLEPDDVERIERLASR